MAGRGRPRRARLEKKANPQDTYSDLVYDGVKHITGSILNKDFVDPMVFLSRNTYEQIYHLAAIVGVDRNVVPEDLLHIDDPDINGTLNLLERVRGSNTCFVYPSTREVF